MFLTVDHDSPPATLAFYEEVIGEISMMPTTCFSRHPDVVPMWAHYGQNGAGFVIEVDEAGLRADLGDSGVIEDVTYRDSRAEDLAQSLARAQFRQKPRDVYFLRNSVYRAAYFTKASCWSYEKERRLVLNDPTDLVNVDGASLRSIPPHCVTAVILGSNVGGPALGSAPVSTAQRLDAGRARAALDAAQRLASDGRMDAVPEMTAAPGLPSGTRQF